jgi:enamine deaminase RidA (YjgF/YER057c/UK114 family)
MKKHLNPPELFPSLKYGFSQVVTSPPGKLIFLSGQVSWDEREQLQGGDDLKAQTLQALRNVEIGLRAAGASLEDIVAMRLYLVDYRPEKSPAITEALHETFAGSEPPTTTWIGVSALASEGLLIEIEATAILEEAQ